MAGIKLKDGEARLIGIIGDDDTVTGMLLAGVGCVIFFFRFIFSEFFFFFFLNFITLNSQTAIPERLLNMVLTTR